METFKQYCTERNIFLPIALAGGLTLGSPNNTTLAGNKPAITQTMTRGIRNNNPGNIEQTKDNWQGAKGNDGRFIIFQDSIFGIRAIGKILRNYEKKYKLNTINGIIDRWAPSTENDTQSYINDVVQKTGFKPDQKLNLQDKQVLLRLIKAIIYHENGQNPYNDNLILKGIDLI